MQCKIFIVQIDDYIAIGKLDIVKRIEMRVHMEACEECRKAYLKRRMQLDPNIRE